MTSSTQRPKSEFFHRTFMGYESQGIEDFHRILKMVPSSEGWTIRDIIVTGPRIPGSLLWDSISHTRGSVCKSSQTWLPQHERNKDNKMDMANYLFGWTFRGLQPYTENYSKLRKAEREKVVFLGMSTTVDYQNQIASSKAHSEQHNIDRDGYIYAIRNICVYKYII